MLEELIALRKAAIDFIKQAKQLDTLETIRVRYFGKKGQFTQLLKSVSQLSIEQRPVVGKAINEAKREIQTLIAEKSTQLEKQALEQQLRCERLDVTLPGRGDTIGTLHPITQVSQRVTQLFTSLGFRVATGPEIEDEYHNFEALNIPANHPARAMADTFYFSGDRLLRTHTSPVQIREMKQCGVPLHLIALGRVYRRDFDQTHTPMFHQLEGLFIDKSVNFAMLKGLLQQFLNQFFEKEIQLRFRPSYFPFTEPSAEVDIYQPESDSWLEVLGCGMVHTNVLEMQGIDSDEYSGFAFGIGLDRLAMLRYHIPDLRLLFENDIRFLRQF